MKFITLLAFLFASLAVYSEEKTRVQIVTLPRVESTLGYWVYINKLLELALEMSKAEYGPYEIRHLHSEMRIRRQLLELEKGDHLSVVVATPTEEWLTNARAVNFPLVKGLASFGLFFILDENQALLRSTKTMEELKKLKIGLGRGWSMGKILEDHGFPVVYSDTYAGLFPMLKANRFQLLMRSVYEIGPELNTYGAEMANLSIAEDIAIFTYLPTYFFVGKQDAILAERLEFGLKAAHASGKIDELFQYYFGEALSLLDVKRRRLFYLTNTNIDATFFERDKPYLLKSILY